MLAFEGPLASLTIDRPTSRNALSQSIWAGFPRAIAEACARSETRVMLIGGAGGNFAAGADIGEFDTVFADRGATRAYLDLMTAATGAIANAPVPVIARIDGMCIGAGVAVALACDLRIADPGASFAVTPAKLGLAYSLTDTRRLAQAVSLSKAKELLFTGERIDAEEALRIGLIDAIGDADAVASKARAIAANSSASHHYTKQIIRSVEQGLISENEDTAAIFADAPQHADFREGVAAFRARRQPAFSTRETDIFGG